MLGCESTKRGDDSYNYNYNYNINRNLNDNHPPGRRPPNHVIVTQGPTDPQRRYALVTWDRNDPESTGYEVLRDGEVIAEVNIDGDPWDDTSYKDEEVAPGEHTYSVRAVADGLLGEESAAFRIHVKTDEDFGQVYEVDSFPGADDSERIEAAIEAASSADGGIVKLSGRTYTLSRGLEITGSNIVLRGSGIDETVIRPDYEGLAGSDACGSPPKIIYFNDTLTDLATSSAQPIYPGQRTVEVTDPQGLAVGQVMLLSETNPEQQPDEFESQNIVFDPGTGRDERYPHESNEIIAIEGSSVTFKYPFSYSFTSHVPWKLYTGGLHNGIELLTIQGRSEDEQTWYDGVWLTGSDLFAAEIKVQWTNRRVAELMGHNLRLVGVQAPYTGPRGYEDGICRYKIQVYKATNALIVGAVMGRSSDDFNLSFITIQQAARVVVRNSTFYKSRTYAVNEHGEGSRELLVENNYFSTGSDDACGVLLGNSTWGFSGPVIIRNNTFEDNQRDIRVDQNSYEVRILDNISRGCRMQFIRGYGWAGPFTSSDLYGSMRMTVARNQVIGGATGILLGLDNGFYPFEGVRDLVIFKNSLDVSGRAIELNGDSGQTNRFQVYENTGSSDYTRPELVAGDYWSKNADGESFGEPTEVLWTTDSFYWEDFDRY